ncbi:MAG: hypothetical protein LAO06_20645 [Acidobacteriia bacterium]|nr:hypothetical protein [Terriglobia bacterium]
MAGVFPALAQSPQPPSNIPPPPKWPMEFQKDGNRLIVYQPQIRDWQKFRELTSDTAVSITPKGGKPLLGVVSWHSTTVADTQTRIVLIKDIKVTHARFPSLDADTSAAMERVVRDTYPHTGMTIGLDRMLAGLRMAQTPARPAAISTQPPAIFVSTSSAILLFVDGDPLRVLIEGTKLEYVVNTTWDLLYDKSDYYLLNQKTWLKAKALSGPWAATTELPLDMAKLPAEQNWDDVRQAIPPVAATTAAQRVVFTAQPAELLLFAGEPAYKKIPKTNLAYATNTENDVFQHSPDHQIYVLISGRWFRAATLQGPWAYAGNDLPPDFAKIPADHPRAHVLASVPGTQAARDAVLLAQVPTTAIVNRAEAEAKVKVVYAGDPQFKLIEGTSLSYAANTQDKVIKVGDLYYLCFQGVWFMSTSPNGPWKTADSVPKQIYEIPPSAPVYNVTYVTQTNPTPTTVESSYTAGYVGMFVLGAAVGACVAYGSGYYYPPYYYYGPHPYPAYYPYPYSYGYRAVYNPTTGAYGVGGAVYGPYGAAGRAAWYNPTTGAYGRGATVQTAYGGRTVAQGYNPYTGTYGATAQGHNAYSQWGSSVVSRGDDWARAGHVSTAQGGVAGYRTSDGGAGRIVYGPEGAAGVAKTANNNVYAGKDGNVYKRDSNGNWSKYDNGNWDPVQQHATGYKPGSSNQTDAKQQLQQRSQTTGTSRDSMQQRAQSAGITQDSVAQARQQRQGTTPSQQSGTLQQRAQSAGVSRDSVTQARQDRSGVTPAAERSRDQAGTQMGQRRSSVSSDTMQQLNHEAAARRQGAAREQTFSRGGGAARVGGGRRR